MNGTILVYGNEEILVTTRRLILEKAGYQAFSATKFDGAVFVLMNQRIDVLLLCQSLSEGQRRGILAKAQAISPQIKCAVFGFDGGKIVLDGGVACEILGGPATLVKTMDRILHDH